MTLNLRIDTGAERVHESIARELTTTGLTSDALSIPLHGVRFAWLDVTLPDETTLRVLAELAGRDGGAIRFRFKHVFPDQREKLARFLEGQEDVSQAA